MEHIVNRWSFFRKEDKSLTKTARGNSINAWNSILESMFNSKMPSFLRIVLFFSVQNSLLLFKHYKILSEKQRILNYWMGVLEMNFSPFSEKSTCRVFDNFHSADMLTFIAQFLSEWRLFRKSPLKWQKNWVPLHSQKNLPVQKVHPCNFQR